jgi:RNA polymerase sigma-70 factor (ECF subfamily)
MAMRPAQPADELHGTFLKAYEEHSDAIFRHVLFRVFDRDKAKDVTQECFLRTWRRLAAGAQIANLRAFLYRTAINLVIDESRKKKSESLEAALESGFEPASTGIRPDAATEAARAAQAIDDMDEIYRDVLRLRYVDGLGPSDIAEILGESENVVSVRLHRGLKLLKEKIN